MEIKTKTELLEMSKEGLEKEENTAWEYFKKVKKYAKRKHPAHQEAREFIKKNKL